MLSPTNAEAGKPGGITLGSVDKPHPKCDEACMYLCRMRELTDEEIGQIWKDCMESPYMQISNPVGFARAILRKAQEK